MALIKCSECHKEISDTVASCPHCGAAIGRAVAGNDGAPDSAAKKAPKRRKWPYIIGAILLFFIIAGISGSDSKRSASNAQAPSAAPPAAHHSLNAGELIDAYQQNEIAADKKFKNKLVRVSGVIEDIGKDILDQAYVAVGTGKQFEIRSVQCFFSKRDEDKLSALRKGQKVTIQGAVEGLMMNVLIRDSAIIK